MKKILSIILLAAMVLCFAACHKNPDDTASLASGQIAYDENGNVVTSGDEEHDHQHDHDHTNSATSSKKNNSNKDDKNSTSSKKNVSRPSLVRPTIVVDEKENMNASAPPVAEKEGAVNKSWSVYLRPESLRYTQAVDAFSTGLSVRETANGKMVASYAMIGYREIMIDTINDEERYAIAASISNDAEYYYDSKKKVGKYFSWADLGITSNDMVWTFDDVLREYKDELVDDDGFIKLPAEIFGQRVIYQAQYLPCKYSTKTGKLEIDGRFPFKDFYIEGGLGENKYKIDGRIYPF